MESKGFVVRTEKILLAVTALFLALLLCLYFWDRRALGGPGVTVETRASAPQETFLPDISPVDVNAASAEELAELPGIGPVLARRIVEYREEHGPFSAEEALMEVSGIGEAKLAGLEGRITLGAADPDSPAEPAEGEGPQ